MTDDEEHALADLREVVGDTYDDIDNVVAYCRAIRNGHTDEKARRIASEATENYVCVPRDDFEQWKRLAQRAEDAYNAGAFTRCKNLRDKLSFKVRRYILNEHAD